MIEALSKGTQRVMRINEGRRMLDLPAVAGGDEILVQQQDIPLSMAGKTQPPVAPPTAPNDDNNDGADPEADANSNERARQIFRSAHARRIAA